MLISKTAAAQLSRVIKKGSRVHIQRSPAGARYTGQQGERRRVIIIGGLSGPSDVDDTPTTCTAAVLERDPATGILSDSGKRITITNFDPDVDAIDDGTYGKAEWLDGVWELYWLACTASTAFASLPTEEF